MAIDSKNTPAAQRKRLPVFPHGSQEKRPHLASLAPQEWGRRLTCGGNLRLGALEKSRRARFILKFNLQIREVQ
jgi:hypothetical protein